jgi:aspartate kinase
MAMKLNSIGCSAVSLCGWQAGIFTDDRFGNANITHIDTLRIRDELEEGKVVIVAGFQGVNENNDITTLGRGGSDTTAIALAAALNADACFIYTDVSGVYTANPRIVEEAKKHDDISYDEMLAMSSLGAKVLHNRSVLMAKRSGVKFEVLSSFDGQRGTLVHDFAQGKYISGVVCDENVAMINVIGIDSGDATCSLFSMLADNNIQVDIIIRSPRSFEGLGVISFSVSANTVGNVIRLLNENETELNYDRLYIEEELAKISAVGSGIADSCVVASKMLAALNGIGLEPKYITTGEIRISVIIPKSRAPEAEKAIHSALFD